MGGGSPTEPTPEVLAKLARTTAERGVVLTLVDPPAAPERRCRYYSLSLHPTLWGEVSLVREWGRHGVRPQRPRRLVTHHPDYDSAAASLPALLARRLRRGYS